MLKDGKLVCGEIRIENCSLCNAECVLCPREKMTRPKITMSWNHFAHLIEQSVELGATDVAVFGYGEPLIDKNIASKIEYATAQGLTTHVTTNGSLLSVKMIKKLLDAGLKHIRFSIHATVPLKYMKVHRNLDWLQVFRRVGNFLKVNKKRGNPCTTHLSVIPIHGETVDEIRATWEKYFDYLEIWKPHNWAYGRDYRVTNPRKKTCGRPHGGPVQINADGKMMVCCMDFDARMTIGDTYKKSILDILQDEPLKIIQGFHESGKLSGLPCAVCDQLNDDSGGILVYSNRDKKRKLNRLSTSKCQI